MNNLKVGYAKADITPMMGISVSGYFKDRFAEGVLDPLEVCATAVNAGENTVIFIVLDTLGVDMEVGAYFKEKIVEATGLPSDAIIISATHTHTGPQLKFGEGNELVPAYRDFVCAKVADAARFAIEDLKPAKMGWKVGKAPNVAFVRRFRMKDGKVRTNPGVGNPDIDYPIGEIDERVNLIRFDREGGDTVLMMNFANHPDVVGGSKISADWPGLVRGIVERCLPGTKAMFINGAQGDINHVNVKAADGEFNDLENDFDDVLRGYGHARHIANVVAGGVLQVYDKVNYVDVDEIKYTEKGIDVPSNKPNKEDLPLAYKYKELHEAGKDEEIPYKGMELTTVVAEALRMVRLENAEDSYEMKMTGVAIGNVGFVTIPGEGFNFIGRELKKAKGWDMVCPLGLSNGYQGYFPTQEAYDEGGYEARSSNFKAGVAELFVKEGTEILGKLRK